MAELSIAIPMCNEYPQVLFTIRSIMEELRDRVDYEIIVVDNFCPEIERVGCHRDGGGDAIAACLSGQKNLKLLKLDTKLSHWNAKDLAIQVSSGKFLWFADAHVIPSRDSLFNMFQYYKENHQELNGSIHMPLTYKILEWNILIYQLDVDLKIGKVHYTFSGFRPSEKPYKVPCMSSCGMMMTRELYDELGGLPPQLGSYGGGENFFNFSQAVLGKNIWIWPGLPLFHHGDTRGYPMRGMDIMMNRGIATFLFGGKELLKLFLSNVRYLDNEIAREKAFMRITSECADQRELIKSKQIMTISEWVKLWT
jgi:hypothetical protein